MAEKDTLLTFFTVANDGEGRLTEKMSRFLSFARRVTSVEHAKSIVKEYSNDYHDARHVCWAYIIGPERQTYLSSDNGEPSGTAGRPILGQINSFGLTDVIVVVVRYFGGIKLGTPGLIAAYREAARLALEDAGTMEITRTEVLKFAVSYADFDKVMRMIKEKNLRIVSQQIEVDCVMELEVPLAVKEEIIQRMSSFITLL